MIVERMLLRMKNVSDSVTGRMIELMIEMGRKTILGVKC